MDESGRITSRPGGGVQIADTGRKTFGKARRKVFLEHLAATCNVKQSALAAGVTARCVYKRRMSDPVFREEWRRALEQGYARLEAMLLERAAGETPIELDGDWPIEPQRFDKELALHLLREHRKGVAGEARPGAAPQPADWSEVEAYFLGRLKALRVRIDGGAA